jgi:hypothetical protein
LTDEKDLLLEVEVALIDVVEEDDDLTAGAPGDISQRGLEVLVALLQLALQKRHLLLRVEPRIGPQEGRREVVPFAVELRGGDPVISERARA